jgi:glutamate synthase domain-containing protein 3
MKAYKDSYPVIIIGSCAGGFLGEYMAGGLIIVLGLDKRTDAPIVGDYCGTGMHGGSMYIRGDIEDYHLGKEVKKFNLNNEDGKLLRMYLKEYCACFSLDLKEIMNSNFKKLIPTSQRPYGKLYAY